MSSASDVSLARYANFRQRRIEISRVPPADEQALVQLFFEHGRQGRFVDVGANDPFQDSQSFHLESLGWRGLLIEPLPSYCDLLRQHRQSPVVQCACSSPANNGKFMPIHVAGVHSTLESQPIAMGAQSQSIMEVPVRTLDSVLEEHGFEPGFELLSIDVEGHEMEVFKGLTLGRWRPRLVLLEDHVLGHQKHDHMCSQGYQLLLRTGLNGWYVPADLAYSFSWAARWEFFRKYWLGLLWRKKRYAR